MKRRRRQQQPQQPSNRKSNRDGDDDTSTPATTRTTTTVSDGEKKNDNKASNKVTVSLALDEFVVEEIRKQADKSQVSFNARVNAILEKYVRFFMQTEQDRVAIIHPSTHQFFLNEIDEVKYTTELKRLAKETIDAILTQTGIPITLDNMIDYVFENVCINGGSIRSVKRYHDDDRRTCLFFTHDYDLKWSRILSAAFSYHIQSLFHYHTIVKLFSQGFEIKILEKDPI
jgi:uncharacterized protein (DUF4415 family)